MAVAAPIVYVLAGPNGAGKTSLYWYEASEVPRLNGDALYQQGYDTYTVEAELRRQLDAWLAQRVSFVIETNAATERDYKLFSTLKAAGYQVEFRYLGLESVNLCQERVAQRVCEGGHDVPPAFIKQRYDNGLSLLKRYYRDFHRLQLYDNSEAQPRLLLDFLPGTMPHPIAPLPIWAEAVCMHIVQREAIYQRLG